MTSECAPLLLIAGDDEAWLSLVALSNQAYLANADFRGPRVDWHDLEQHCRGELICLTGAPMVGVLSPLVENASDPGNPTEAVALTRRLAELFPHLYIELAHHHHHPREKLINRGLVALAQRLDLPLVATNAVRFARKQDALYIEPSGGHRPPPARRGRHWQHRRRRLGRAGAAAVVAEMVRLVRPGGWVVAAEADIVPLLCHPPHQAWDRLGELFVTVYRQDGADPFLGRRLPELFRQAGLTSIGVEARADVYPLGHPRRTILPDLVWSLRPND